MVSATSSDRFFRDIVGSMRNGVIAITRDGHIAVMNDVACHALHVPVRATNIGGHYADVLHGAPEVVRILHAAFEAEHLPNRAELRLKSTGRVIGYTLSLIRDDDGEVSGATLFFKDLTRVEQLEERERLRDRLAALGEMAAAIAHEVKNPLAGIEVMAGLLRRRLRRAARGAGDAHRHHQRSEDGQRHRHRGARLRAADPAAGRAGAGGAACCTTPCTAPRRWSRAAARGCASTCPTRCRPIEGDAGQLRQLFTNLVSNAFEALDGRGTVTITAQYVPGDEARRDTLASTPTVVVDVADDGAGIADDLQDRIFNPFFTTKPRGSGLGLAIVRKIVDAHDGRISVASPPAGRRPLPRRPAAERPARSQRRTGAAGRRRPRRPAQALTQTSDEVSRQPWVAFSSPTITIRCAAAWPAAWPKPATTSTKPRTATPPSRSCTRAPSTSC